MRYLFCVLLSLCASVGLIAGEPVMIVHPSVGIEEIDAGDVKKIFTGRDKKWPNDVRVAVSLQKSGDLADAFSDKYIGRNSKKVLGLWKKQVFAGKAKMPEVFEDDAAVLKWVAETEGAVGYVDSEGVAEAEGVTVVAIKE